MYINVKKACYSEGAIAVYNARYNTKNVDFKVIEWDIRFFALYEKLKTKSHSA